MKRLTYDGLLAVLRQVGIVAGDFLHVQGDICRIGPVEADGGDAILEFYFRAFTEVLGPQGTLTVATQFEDYGRWALPFHRESSPSRGGVFSEYVRTRPGAVRSIHPICSVTGVGRLAREVCDRAHYDGYGYDTPWGELHRRNAKIMTLGMGAGLGGLSFVHYVERVVGVPYQYTKIFTTPVYDHGVEQRGPFTMSVRYLDFGIADTSIRIKQRMASAGTAKTARIGRSELWVAEAGVLFDTVVAALRDDRYVLLQDPPAFRPGEMPMDGTTGVKQDRYERAEPHESR